MNYETLYKRTKTGAIQYWQIETRTSDLLEGTQIRKESGQLGTTSPVVHIEAVHKGKNIGRSNETTPAEQAYAQALSDWKRKHDEGYKTLQDLGIDNYKSYSDEQLNNILQVALPKFNTDSSGNAKPMLATDYTKVKRVKYPAFCQPKLDGVRCLMIVDGEEGTEVTFLSRSGKPYTTLNHIANDVYDAQSSGRIRRGFILDGEIYSEELTFQEIVSAVKAFKPSSLKLKFRAYDIVTDEEQVDRILDLKHRVLWIGSNHISVVDNFMVHGIKEVKDLHDMWVKEGYEGAMIRHIQGKYAQGQRSRDLLKVKVFDEQEFAFKNFEFGQRGVEDLIAVCWNEHGIEFRAKVIGTVAQKEELYKENDASEGRSFTIKHFGWTEDGLPRFPIGKGFRDGY